MSGTVGDYSAAKQIVKETLVGNSDASIFLALAQKNLLLMAILRGYGNKIREISNQAAIEGHLQASKDGKSIANILIAQSDAIAYSIASRVRDSWSSRGEEELPEGKRVLYSQKILGSPVKVSCSQEDLRAIYGDLSRFFTGENPSGILKKEKKLLFKAKTSLPLICDFVPSKVLDVLQIKNVPGTKSVFLTYFRNRVEAKPDLGETNV